MLIAHDQTKRRPIGRLFHEEVQPSVFAFLRASIIGMASA